VLAFRFDGTRLRAARKAAGFETPEALGNEIDRSGALIHLFECGYRVPTPAKLVELGVVLDVSIESLFVEVKEAETVAQ
jgi:transcriptional regulator with XRE-family HTH domain